MLNFRVTKELPSFPVFLVFLALQYVRIAQFREDSSARWLSASGSRLSTLDFGCGSAALCSFAASKQENDGVKKLGRCNSIEAEAVEDKQLGGEHELALWPGGFCLHLTFL